MTRTYGTPGRERRRAARAKGDLLAIGAAATLGTGNFAVPRTAGRQDTTRAAR
jgi:hypothetical protein